MVKTTISELLGTLLILGTYNWLFVKAGYKNWSKEMWLSVLIISTGISLVKWR